MGSLTSSSTPLTGGRLVKSISRVLKKRLPSLNEIREANRKKKKKKRLDLRAGVLRPSIQPTSSAHANYPFRLRRRRRHTIQESYRSGLLLSAAAEHSGTFIIIKVAEKGQSNGKQKIKQRRPTRMTGLVSSTNKIIPKKQIIKD